MASFKYWGEITVNDNVSAFAFNPVRPIFACGLLENGTLSTFQGESHSAKFSTWKPDKEFRPTGCRDIECLEWSVSLI